jgi:hypothetical protein
MSVMGLRTMMSMMELRMMEWSLRRRLRFSWILMRRRMVSKKLCTCVVLLLYRPYQQMIMKSLS